MKKRAREWMIKEQMRLIQMWNDDYNAAEIAEEIGRDLEEVKYRLGVLGFRSHSKKTWIEEDIITLAEMLRGGATYKECAKRLGRSIPSIKHQWYRIRQGGIYAVLTFLFFLPASAQSVVVDGGFDNVSGCPAWFSWTLTSWQQVVNSPDNFTQGCGIPTNFWGYQSGNNYAGFYARQPGAEGFFGTLSPPLPSGIVVAIYIRHNIGDISRYYCSYNVRLNAVNAYPVSMPTDTAKWQEWRDTVVLTASAWTIEIEPNDSCIFNGMLSGVGSAYIYIDSISVVPLSPLLGRVSGFDRPLRWFRLPGFPAIEYNEAGEKRKICK